MSDTETWGMILTALVAVSAAIALLAPSPRTYDWRCKHCGVGGRAHSVHRAEIESRDHLRRVHYCSPEIMPHA